MDTTEDALQAGREALERHVWHDAFELLSKADADAPIGPEDLELLGQAAWWAGRLQDAIRARERAYAAHAEAGDERAAAAVALKIARDHARSLRASVAGGWYARAERLLAGVPEGREHGYLARDRANIAFEKGDIDGALRLAEEAVGIGMRVADANVQALALQTKGIAMVAGGRVEEGLALQDEATVAAVGGELDPEVTGIIYCNIIATCAEMADYRRAGEWTEAATRWCERQSISGFPGVCRVHRAEIMRLRGAWSEAEEEARLACTELKGFGFFNVAMDAFYELGEIRYRMGDLAGAEDAFRQANELGREPVPGLALVRLAQGRTEAALSAINRGVADAPADPLRRAKLLPAQVRISIAAGEPSLADEAAAELQGTAEAFGTPALEAMALDCRAAVEIARGAPAEARPLLRKAIGLWREVDLPYEMAVSRLRLGVAYRMAGDEESAALEMEAARSTFVRLGAALDARLVSSLLEEAGAARAEAVERTFMFTDIVRSTDLVEAIGDEAWADLVRWHDLALRRSFGAHGGEEVDHAGDGFFVAFESPQTAVVCAVEIQRNLAEHRHAAGFAPQVRIGLHAAGTTRQGRAYLGKGVHAAARIGALAQGGEIVASRATFEAAGSGLREGESREVTLKGIAKPVEVVTLQWRPVPGS